MFIPSHQVFTHINKIPPESSVPQAEEFHYKWLTHTNILLLEKSLTEQESESNLWMERSVFINWCHIASIGCHISKSWAMGSWGRISAFTSMARASDTGEMLDSSAVKPGHGLKLILYIGSSLLIPYWPWIIPLLCSLQSRHPPLDVNLHADKILLIAILPRLIQHI